MSTRLIQTGFLALFTLVVTATDVCAFVGEGEVGEVRLRVMAPDWICSGEVVSLLVVATSMETAKGGSTQVDVALTPPTSGFTGEENAKRDQSVTMTAGRTLRFAFTGWKAGSEETTGTFALRFSAPEAGGSSNAPFELAIPVRVIRGAAVPKGLWSILVPAGIASLAIPVFLIFLRRFAQRGAWRQAVDLDVRVAEEAWWKSDS